MDLRPDLGVRVAVRDGRLTGVSLRAVAAGTRAGQDLAGAYCPGSRGWRSGQPSRGRLSATRVPRPGTENPRGTGSCPGDLTGVPQ
ncbi:MAG TPA: hypothetical protein VF933_10035 [Streptosporangiaceae bacterium]